MPCRGGMKKEGGAGGVSPSGFSKPSLGPTKGPSSLGPPGSTAQAESARNGTARYRLRLVLARSCMAGRAFCNHDAKADEPASAVRVSPTATHAEVACRIGRPPSARYAL